MGLSQEPNSSDRCCCPPARTQHSYLQLHKLLRMAKLPKASHVSTDLPLRFSSLALFSAEASQSPTPDVDTKATETPRWRAHTLLGSVPFPQAHGCAGHRHRDL